MTASSSPDEGEAEVFGELERPDGVHDPVVPHRRHQGDRVADEQRPPCPAIATAEGRDSDSAAHQPEHHVVDAVHPEEHEHVLGGHRRRAQKLRPGAAGVALVAGGQNRLATWSEQAIGHCSRHCAPRDVSHIDDEDENPGEAARVLHVGSPPVSLRIHRMHVCPKSTPAPYIIGQAPAITLISC